MSSAGSIIVVDDELDLASLFKAFLERQGYCYIFYRSTIGFGLLRKLIIYIL